MKNVLYIKNYPNGIDITFLSNKYDGLCIKNIISKELIEMDAKELNKLVSTYDIFIFGGGPQHLTKNLIDNYPEILNQIKLIHLLSKNKNKLVIGICLGIQIIAYSFGYEIVKLNKLCVGFNYLDTNSIRTKEQQDKVNSDKYLSKLDFELLSKSFSYHYDRIDENKKINFKTLNQNNNYNDIDDDIDDDIYVIAYSKSGIPYIIKNKNSNIYGFQFHPELTTEYVLKIFNEKFSLSNYFDDIDKFDDDNKKNDKQDISYLDIDMINEIANNIKFFDDKILYHFFDIFFS